MADDVTVNFGPPQALMLQSEQIKHVQVDGLLKGTVMLKGAKGSSWIPNTQSTAVVSVGGLDCSAPRAL